MEDVYKLGSGFKVFFWILAVLCILMVFTIPFAILIIVLIFRAEVKLTPYTLERVWMGKKVWNINEITELKWLPTPGFLQKMMRPLMVVSKNPTKTVKAGIPVGTFERTEELVAELEKRTGKKVVR